MMIDMSELLTVDQFCIRVDQTNEIADLCDMHDYLSANKRKYSLVNLRFMIEHMQGRSAYLGRRDAEELKQVLTEAGLL